MGKPLTLLFDSYETVAIFLAGMVLSSPLKATAQLIVVTVLTVNYVVQDGKSNWAEVRVSIPTITEF